MTTKILLIEDEAMLRTDVAEWLGFEGYEISTAEDGIVGIEMALHELPDLIVCDIMMPRLDGYGVLFELRSNAKTMNTSFIFTTAKVTHDDLRKGMAAGADDYLTKPYSRDELLQAIETCLEKKAAHERQHQAELAQLQAALEGEHEQGLLKARMVAMFAHDFRNPLASIMASVGLLRDYAERMDEAGRLRHVNRMDGSVRQLSQMLDDMLFMAQMDSMSFKVDLELLYAEQFVEHIVKEFQLIYAESHPIRFESNIGEKVLSDSRLMRQITANLISNAIKYSPDGQDIYVSFNKKDTQYILTVKDAGIGISEIDQARLFNCFQRGSNVGSIKGTGLGLAIVKQGLDLLGGSVRLESQMGQGTTVTVFLPIQ
jgi:two-component system sensor histidine kinase/response regulator